MPQILLENQSKLTKLKCTSNWRTMDSLSLFMPLIFSKNQSEVFQVEHVLY